MYRMAVEKGSIVVKKAKRATRVPALTVSMETVHHSPNRHGAFRRSGRHPAVELDRHSQLWSATQTVRAYRAHAEKPTNER